MHRSYFLFEKQTTEITPQLLGAEIVRVFTYRKNELVFHLKGKEEFYLKISIDVNYPYFILSGFHNIRQPKLELFSPLYGETIVKAEIKPHDKQLLLRSEHYNMFSIFYGSHPNILLLDQDLNLVESFKDDLPQVVPEKDSENVFDFRTIPKERLTKLLEAEPHQKLGYFLRRHCRAINKTMAREIIFRLNLKEDTPLSRLDGADALLNVFNQLSAEFSAQGCYLYYIEDRLQKIAPFHLRHLESTGQMVTKEFATVNEAWQRFAEEKPLSQKFDSLYKTCQQAIEKRLAYLRQSLQKLAAAQDIARFKQEAELKGNLLLTFKHRIKKGASKVVVDNVFSPQQEKIEIKLNPKLSVVENANRYFNKYKNVRERMEISKIKRQTLEKELKEIEALQEKLSGSTRLKKLEQLHRQIIERGLIQNPDAKKQKDTLYAHRFMRIILDPDWDVYVGKNDRNNEMLTFSFAHKWDVWLHAQGVPGSHVIIRVPRRDLHPPAKIIEQAARIAAAYSKARHSATVPVMYTEARYVRRLRKGAPGAVSVQNEKVIFVEPLKLNG